MLIVFPVSASDHELVLPMTKVIEKLGPNNMHTALVVATPTAVNAGQILATKISKYFRDVDMKILDFEPSGGWPGACNQHFRAVADLVHQDPKHTAPWYFFELDNTPLKPGWVDTLHFEYQQAAMPFMGVVHPTHFVSARDPETNEVTDFHQQGSHMVGTGIYPNDLWTRSVLLHFMVQPFDVEMQYEIVPHCHHTKLIQHNWNSGKYHNHNGQIVCKSLHEGRSPLDHAKSVGKNAVVVHGCKDGSLADVICAKRTFN